jgi:hypothetical protein
MDRICAKKRRFSTAPLFGAVENHRPRKGLDRTQNWQSRSHITHENPGCAGRCWMIRIVFVAVVLMVAWCALAKLVQALKTANIDWTGVTAAIAFIVLAFWLRHVTGIGGF